MLECYAEAIVGYSIFLVTIPPCCTAHTLKLDVWQKKVNAAVNFIKVWLSPDKLWWKNDAMIIEKEDHSLCFVSANSY